MPRPIATDFPVVAIGASAGGLEALELFLAGVPRDAEIAFVVVQHLGPSHRGILSELLQRSTSLRVSQARNRVKVEPGHVYVIPPDRDLTVARGRLLVSAPAEPRGLRLTVDAFFRSLAAERGERAVGVVLSGMGSDGTAGLRAIKERAGLAVVQSPADARFDGMPRSAIDAGLADIVAPAAELPGRILAYLGGAPLLGAPRPALDTASLTSLEKVLLLLRQRTGHDFRPYKKSTLYRRIERRMGIHQIDRIAAYVRFLQESAAETELLFKELLIGVTSFFRDPAAWEELKTEALEPLLARRGAGGPLRVWAPGCSTGEEAYSIAIALREVADQLGASAHRTAQIFATDIDSEAIEKARLGLFPPNVAADVSGERLRRFFVQEEAGFRVAKEIREMVVFAVQNAIADPPFTRLDLLSCRNLLIYLEPETQKKLVRLFHYSLTPGGVLFLGGAETVGGSSEHFKPLGRSKIYRRGDATLRFDTLSLPASAGPAEAPGDAVTRETFSGARAGLQEHTEKAILARHAPAAVLVNGDGDLLYVCGRTGKFLEPPAGKANLNVFGMAREGLRYELTAAFQKARRQRSPVRLRGIQVRTDHGTRALDLTVEPVEEPPALAGTTLVVFHEIPEAPPERPRRPGRGRPPAGDTVVAELEAALKEAQSALLTTREEMQSSQEELKSANEEMQSANEELQSTNEELTTSKEEMQSMNEELQTLNTQLLAKVEELSRANNDMRNLLDSADIATLFLDGDLRVRRFTMPATRLIRLIASDVGRPITDITTRLDYPELADDAREVLRTLSSREKEVSSEGDRWFSARMLPYRTEDNRIDGVVVIFTEITAVKALEQALLGAKGVQSAKGPEQE